MRNLYKLLGITAMLAVIVFSLAGCGGEPAHVHDWGAWTETKSATCIATGSQTRTCALDATHTETEVIPVNDDHDYGDWTGVTCTTAGEGTRVCSRNAGHTETKQLDALGHDYQNYTQTTAPTCTTAGVETGTCTRDQATTTRAAAINPAAHNWEQSEGTAPTCTANGNGVQICSYNNEHIQSGVLLALGHDYQNYTQTTAPTCTTAGVETGTCTHDSNHTTTRAGAVALGHDYQNYTQTTAPTCTTAGVETGTCTRDQVTTTRSGAVAIGHNFQWVQTTAPSFIEEGVEQEKCTHDNEHTRETRTASSLPITTTQEWSNALSLINNKAGNYTLTIGDSFIVAGSTTNTFGTTANGSTLTVTLKGSGTVSLSSQGNMIRIAANQTLVIDSETLILQGLTNGQNGATQNNNISVVYVSAAAAKLELKNGTITGNTYSGTEGGGGVYVRGGTFTMSGGEISGNTISAPMSTNFSGGGGVYVDSGSFTMSSGKISGNKANYASEFSAQGGGVYVGGISNQNAFFTMIGGEITGNTAYAGGGGVRVNRYGSFTMMGGTISNNSVSYTSASSYGGGGVSVLGIFRIVTGIVYGSNGSLPNTAINGSALYINTSGTPTAQRGTFSIPGDITSEWNSSGNLSTTHSTINVVNGVLQ